MTLATARTAAMSVGDELATAITQLRADAGEGGADLDVSAAYTDPSVHDADTDWGRHRDAGAALEAAGVDLGDRAGAGGLGGSCAAFLERFGKEIASLA